MNGAFGSVLHWSEHLVLFYIGRGRTYRTLLLHRTSHLTICLQTIRSKPLPWNCSDTEQDISFVNEGVLSDRPRGYFIALINSSCESILFTTRRKSGRRNHERVNVWLIQELKWRQDVVYLLQMYSLICCFLLLKWPEVCEWKNNDGPHWPLSTLTGRT